MSTPDYAAELAFATWLANQQREDIDTVTISETLPDELWSEEAVERIENLMSCFTAEVNAQTEIAYTHGGKTR